MQNRQQASCLVDVLCCLNLLLMAVVCLPFEAVSPKSVVDLEDHTSPFVWRSSLKCFGYVACW